MRLPDFSNISVLVIGDLMVDEYLWGEVDRISPEAPVPVVNIQRESYTLGGAGNVVNNLVELGAQVSIIGIAGSDQWGHLLLEHLKRLNIDVAGVIQDGGRPTVRKTRIIGANQQMLRIDREDHSPLHQHYFNPIYSRLEEKIPSADAVIVSDYGKGLITDHLMESIAAIAQHHQKPVIADPKGMVFTKYTGVTLLTPNKKEAGLAAGIDITDDETLMRAGRRLMDQAQPEALLITCGKEGMVLIQKNQAPYWIKAKAKQVFDVSGAGDTVVAMMGLGIASGLTLAESASLANTAAGIVVGKIGTATVSLAELEENL
ncbi:MAG: D-glycero-beta-D-manno-heptose-7-phosphate kinase [Desulfobacterales bacterium]|nr:D-glycero-beta-D-manno-heptose-7-phosphate kinase [Desulfobacterales bacterium]